MTPSNYWKYVKSCYTHCGVPSHHNRLALVPLLPFAIAMKKFLLAFVLKRKWKECNFISSRFRKRPYSAALWLLFSFRSYFYSHKLFVFIYERAIVCSTTKFVNIIQTLLLFSLFFFSVQNREQYLSQWQCNQASLNTIVSSPLL